MIGKTKEMEKMKTKTLVIILAIVCLLFVRATGYFQFYDVAEEPVAELDYLTLYSLYDADKTIAKVDGEDVTWAEYSEYFVDYAQQIEYYFAQMETYYGIQMTWDDQADEEGNVYADIPKQYAEAYVTEDKVLEKTANDIGEVYDPHDSESIYNIFYAMYGEQGEKISDEESLGWLEDNGYMHCMHILFSTIDMTTYEELDEDEIKQKYENAQRIAEELKATEDEEDRYEKFKEYMNEYSEDSGLVSYPDGYTFTDGTMVEEFETATKELNEYEVSEPVKSSYGYHIIIRLPLDANADISADTGAPAKLTCAYEKFETQIYELMQEANFEYVDDAEIPDIREYIY